MKLGYMITIWQKILISIEIKSKSDIPGEISYIPFRKKLKLLVIKGDKKVTKGEPIIVTEAMKMETTITAPIDGTVIC